MLELPYLHFLRVTSPFSIIAFVDIFIETCWSYLNFVFVRVTSPFSIIAVVDILIEKCWSYLTFIFRVTSPFSKIAFVDIFIANVEVTSSSFL